MIYRNGRYYDRMIRNGITYDRMIRNGIQYGQPPSPAQGYTISLTLSGTPTSIAFADLKYNKQGVFSMDWDDGSLSSLDAATLFESLNTTDGTGASKPWRGGVSVIGRSSFNDGELGNNPASGAIQYDQMQGLIAKGWDIQNHGLYSNTSGNFVSDTPLDDIIDLDTLIMDRIGYKLATTVVPAAEIGYVQGALTAGHLAVTSQRDDVGEGMPSIPSAEWQPLTDISTWDPGFKYLLRLFTDAWDGGGNIPGKVDDLLANSGASVHKLLRIGTHDSDQAGFETFITDLAGDSLDRLWGCSMRELMEYLMIRDQGVITVNGNMVSVEVPLGLRWEDFTLIVEGSTVTDATSPDADNVTFSGNMVNFYKDNFG